MVRLRELDVPVVDHLDEVAPGVDEVVPANLDAGLPRELEGTLLVVDDEAEVTMSIGRLRAPGCERDELVADVDERHPTGAAAELHVEDAPVEAERLLDVVHLEGDMIDTDEPRALRHGGIFAPVDTYLTIASRRETRRYSDEPIPDDVVNRILDAGRLAGSGSNRQPWMFYAVESRDVIEGLADVVYAPDNIRGARLVVLVTVRGKGPVSFDAGRAAQNMLLAAWNEGVGGSPNGFTDGDRAAALVGAGEEERPVIALSLGYPARPRDPSARPAEEWSRRAKRRPLDDVVVRR